MKIVPENIDTNPVKKYVALSVVLVLFFFVLESIPLLFKTFGVWDFIILSVIDYYACTRLFVYLVSKESEEQLS